MSWGDPALLAAPHDPGSMFTRASEPIHERVQWGAVTDSPVRRRRPAGDPHPDLARTLV